MSAGWRMVLSQSEASSSVSLSDLRPKLHCKASTCNLQTMAGGSCDHIYLLSLSLARFIARNWSCAKRRCILLQRLWIAMEIYDSASKILSIDTGRRKYHIVSKINWAALSTDSIEANSFFSFKTSSLTLKRLVVSCRARAVGPEVLHIFKLKKIRTTDWSLKIDLFWGISLVNF